MVPQGALATKVNDVIATLGLTQEEVGSIVDASPRTVARWSSGQVTPQKLNKQRLLELAYVADVAADVFPPDKVNLWLLSPNRQLDHDTPAERIRAGHFKDVLGLMEAIADGVVI